MKGQLKWLPGGIFLGFVFLLAVSLSKPVGVSTEFVILNAMLGDAVNDTLVEADAPGSKTYHSSNSYLNQSGGKLAAEAANPLNYGFLFLGGLMVGAFLSSRMGGPRAEGQDRMAPAVFRQRFGNARGLRYTMTFLSGVLVLLGARLAGGCTSGHMMSGMMQTSLSGYVFTASVFLTALPVAFLVYGRGKGGV
ncbi:MAG TPA: YeeE/YedE thiosulfate transporter family protein [Pseudomonadales bacterium]